MEKELEPIINTKLIPNKPSKFSFFKKIASFKISLFKKQLNENSINLFTTNSLKKEIIAKAQSLLEQEQFILYQELIEIGYKPHKEQLEKFENRIVDLFHTASKRETLEHLLNNNFILTDNMLKKIYFTYSFQHLFNDIYFKIENNLYKNDKEILTILNRRDIYHPIFFEQMKQFLSKSENKSVLLNQWAINVRKAFDGIILTENESVNPYRFLHNYVSNHCSFEDKKNSAIILQELQTLFTKHKNSLTPFLDLVSELKKYVDDLNIPAEYLIRDDIKDLFDKTKLVFGTNKSLDPKKIEEKLIQNSTSLPFEAQQIIKEISLIHQKIIKDFQLLDISTQLDIDRFASKRIPELIDNYNSIDVDLRNVLLDKNNKKPLDILLSSLHNIYEYLNSTYLHINQRKIDNLTVSETYTKSYLKKF